MSIHSGDLRSAIEQLRPELPQLLGPNHPTFEVELESILLGGSDNQLLDLFGRYPDAHERLLDILDQQREEEATKGLERLFGDPITPRPAFCYRCNNGSSHTVAPEDVVERDLAGQALCPQHHTVMTLERPCQGGE